MSHTPASQQVAVLFHKDLVLDMPTIERSVCGRSRRSLFRDLEALGYLSSYTHTGRYYTLASLPQFDPDGLWRYQGIGFSRDGTLKATVKRIVETADSGRTQRELQLRLGVRVHNPLLDLVEHKQLGRQTVEREFVYVAAQHAQAESQLARRRAGIGLKALAAPPALEVEVLVEVLHGARLPPPDAAQVAARLEARGVHAPVAAVAAVLVRHGLEKKTAPSRSQRSRR